MSHQSIYPEDGCYCDICEEKRLDAIVRNQRSMAAFQRFKDEEAYKEFKRGICAIAVLIAVSFAILFVLFNVILGSNVGVVDLVLCIPGLLAFGCSLFVVVGFGWMAVVQLFKICGWDLSVRPIKEQETRK